MHPLSHDHQLSMFCELSEEDPEFQCIASIMLLPVCMHVHFQDLCWEYQF